MLTQTLQSINNILDKLIDITNQDIKDIKQANHEPLFERNSQKEELINQFGDLKSQIDSVLVERSQRGFTLENMFNEQEDKLFEEFKTKLQKFHTIHTKFARLAYAVSNFYNVLVNKLSGNEVDIGYEVTKKNSNFSTFSLKG
jgi:23S rRNA maturation-related 3'-5' exoribonuclease YhaM